MTIIELFRLPSPGIIHQYNYMVGLIRRAQQEIGRTDTGVIMFFGANEPSSIDSSPFYEMFMYLIANLSQIPIKDIDTYLSRKNSFKRSKSMLKIILICG